ncbi:MFS transporter [Gordonia shandongensis]|uniref:MFS transporter n=1 Tax=Gordonia shandongensis TaxID=376351 RepID=UPI0003F4DB1F|nr:MFS transporter [Gordonia shandongensis]
MTSPVAVNSIGMSRTRAWIATAVLSASLLVVVMDMTILNIALPSLAKDLSPSADQQLWIVDVYSLVLAGLLVPASSLADRFGRRLILLVGFGLFGLASALILVAGSPGAVIAIRALLGVGGALIMPTTLSMVRTLFDDPTERARALALWSSVAGVGVAIGPLIGGFLLEHFSWHSAFLVNVPLMLIAIVLGVFLLPESRSATPGGWDWISVITAFAGMALMMWAVKHFGAESSLRPPMGWVALLAGAALLVVFVRRCLTLERPMLDLDLFSSRIFSAGIIAALGSMFSMAAAMLLFAQWLQAVEGSSPVQAGAQFLPLAAAGAVASMAAPWLAERIGPRIVISAGILVAAVGMIGVWVIPTWVTSGDLDYVYAVGPLALVGVGMGSLAIGSSLIMSGSPEDRAGNAAAMEETSYEVGNVLGVSLLGSVAAVLYRGELDGSGVLGDLDTTVSDHVRESIGSAVGVAEGGGNAALADAAGTAFTDAMSVTSLVGGVLMLGVAAAVYALIPRGTRLDARIDSGAPVDGPAPAADPGTRA